MFFSLNFGSEYFPSSMLSDSDADEKSVLCSSTQFSSLSFQSARQYKFHQSGLLNDKCRDALASEEASISALKFPSQIEGDKSKLKGCYQPHKL
jgi:hypothetical protein